VFSWAIAEFLGKINNCYSAVRYKILQGVVVHHWAHISPHKLYSISRGMWHSRLLLADDYVCICVYCEWKTWLLLLLNCFLLTADARFICMGRLVAEHWFTEKSCNKILYIAEQRIWKLPQCKKVLTLHFEKNVFKFLSLKMAVALTLLRSVSMVS